MTPFFFAFVFSSCVSSSVSLSLLQAKNPNLLAHLQPQFSGPAARLQFFFSFSLCCRAPESSPVFPARWNLLLSACVPRCSLRLPRLPWRGPHLVFPLFLYSLPCSLALQIKAPRTISPACVPQERVKFSAIHPFSSKTRELRFVLVSQVLGYLPAVSPPSFLVFRLHVFSKRPDLPLIPLILESQISFAVPLLPQAVASVPPLFLFSGQPPLGKYLPASYVFCLL